MVTVLESDKEICDECGMVHTDIMEDEVDEKPAKLTWVCNTAPKGAYEDDLIGLVKR